MPTGIFVKIKIHPFYQEYLRNHYDQHELVFRFPPRDRFMFLIELFLQRYPHNETNVFNSGEGKDVLRVEIPTMKHKDPYYYNYLSRKSNDYISTRLKKFVQHLIFDEIYELRKKGLYKDEVIHVLMENNNISLKYEDLIKKAYNRALEAERKRRMRKKRKKSYNYNA